MIGFRRSLLPILFSLNAASLTAVEPTAAAPVADAADDAKAIAELLATYQAAVSHKDQAQFETLLLATDIPFAFVPARPVAGGSAAWRDYDGFRKAVFGGPAFTQTFSDVQVRRHGALADVDLVYRNNDGHTVFAGWKTMQLIKVAGRWKIASEFFTDAGAAR